MRDTQRRRIYDAERAAFAPFGEDAPLMALADICRLVDRIVEGRWWRERYAWRCIYVLDGRARRSACAKHLGGDTVELCFPRHMRYRWVVLHELAHAAVGATRQGPHGPDFAAAYLALVRRYIGRDAERRLAGAFAHCGVRATGRRLRKLDGSERMQIAACRERAVARRKLGRSFTCRVCGKPTREAWSLQDDEPGCDGCHSWYHAALVDSLP